MHYRRARRYWLWKSASGIDDISCWCCYNAGCIVECSTTVNTYLFLTLFPTFLLVFALLIFPQALSRMSQGAGVILFFLF